MWETPHSFYWAAAAEPDPPHCTTLPCSQTMWRAELLRRKIDSWNEECWEASLIPLSDYSYWPENHVEGCSEFQAGWFQQRMLASLFPAWCWLSCGICRLGRLCYQRGAWYSTGVLGELPICSLEFDSTGAQTTACFSFANFWMQGGMGEAFGVAFTSKASRY